MNSGDLAPIATVHVQGRCCLRRAGIVASMLASQKPRKRIKLLSSGGRLGQRVSEFLFRSAKLRRETTFDIYDWPEC